MPDGHGGAQDVDHEERPTERVQEHGHDQPEDCPPDDATVDVSLHGGTLPEYVDACQLLRVTFWLTTLNRIFRYVVVSNWKSRAEAALRDPIGDTRCMIWKDRSLVLNFLFGMRRYDTALGLTTERRVVLIALRPTGGRFHRMTSFCCSWRSTTLVLAPT